MSAALYKKWRKWLQRIEKQQLLDLITNQRIFHVLQDCTEPYRDTYTGGRLSRWMVQNYVAFATTAIRRMSESSKSNWKSISLVILLEDMAKHDTVLTRERFRRIFTRTVMPLHADDQFTAEHADRTFDRVTRSEGAVAVSEARIQQDIKEIEDTCAPIKKLVDKVVAHTEEDRRKVGKAKFSQIDKAIELLEKTFQRYSVLVNGSVCNPLLPFGDNDVRVDLQRI